jgi:hypothetical protein
VWSLSNAVTHAVSTSSDASMLPAATHPSPRASPLVPSDCEPLNTADPPRTSTAENWRHCGYDATALTCATAPSASRPLASASSSAGPSRGSVTFCVAAAPTPART